MENVIITGFSNATSEGVTLHLNKKTSLKTGNIRSDKFWVSWDKICSALLDGYTGRQEVAERNELRNSTPLVDVDTPLKRTVKHHMDETYCVMEGESAVFLGSLSDCEAWIRLTDMGQL